MKYRYTCEECGRVHILPWEPEGLDSDRQGRLHKCDCGSHTSIPDRIAPGVMIDAYEILTRLGKGGMGTVWRARQRRHSTDREWSREVALKIWEPAKDGYDNQFTRTLFVSEAQTLAEIQHPNVVTIHDFGTEGDVLYLVMELIKGKTLEQILDFTVFSEGQTMQFAYTVALALGDCWEQHRLLHRDLKPGNLIVDRSNHLHILDLGLARVGESRRLESIHGMAVGTPNYMSPEQSRGDDVDPRSDIYSLGCTLFHLLTGKRPFSGMSSTEIIRAQRVDPLPGPNNDQPKVSKACKRILARMTEKDPEDRYQDWSELADDLKVLVRQYPSSISDVIDPDDQVSSSLSTVVPSKDYPSNKDPGGKKRKTASSARTGSGSSRASKKRSKRRSSRRKSPRRWLMALMLSLPLVLGVVIGAMLMGPTLQTDAVYDQIKKQQEEIDQVQHELKQAGIQTKTVFGGFNDQMEDARRMLVNGQGREALDTSENVGKSLDDLLAQHAAAEMAQQGFVTAADQMPEAQNGADGEFPSNVVRLVELSLGTGATAQEQFLSGEDFAGAAKTFKKASYLAYQAGPALELEAVRGAYDLALESEADRWVPEEWHDATNAFGRAEREIPKLRSPDVEELLSEMRSISNQFVDTRSQALDLFAEFEGVSKLADELDEPVQPLVGTASERKAFLREKMLALREVNGSQTREAVESLLSSNAICNANDRLAKGIERGLDEEAVTELRGMINKWVFGHLGRCIPQGNDLNAFLAAIEKWKLGRGIEKQNAAPNCGLLPMDTKPLKALAENLAKPGGGLKDIPAWQEFGEALPVISKDLGLNLGGAVKAEIDRLNLEKTWGGITKGIKNAEAMDRKKQLEDAGAFLAKHPDETKQNWVNTEWQVFCGMVKDAMVKVEGKRLEDLSRALREHTSINWLRELAASPVLQCPDPLVQSYVSHYDDLTNFVHDVRQPSKWSLGDRVPIEGWATYFRPAGDLTMYRQIIEPATLHETLLETAERMILPEIKSKSAKLPKKKNELETLNLQLLSALSAASAKPLREPLIELRGAVMKRLETIDKGKDAPTDEKENAEQEKKSEKKEPPEPSEK